MVVAAEKKDRSAFRSALLDGSVGRWNGRLEVYSGAEVVGNVVLSQGEVAWATCRFQPEHLGSFLRRLGHVSREQMDQAKAEYQRLGGRKKLGGLLEEAGIVSRPVLRRCLLLHIKTALACLFRSATLESCWLEGQAVPDGELTFPLEEVFPELVAPENLRLEGDYQDAEVLATFESISGYRAAVVADARGEALAFHSLEEHDAGEPPILAITAATLIEGAAHTARRVGLGDVEFVILEGTDGAVVCRWLDPDHNRLVALFLEPSGMIGVAKHKLQAADTKIRRFIMSDITAGE